MIGRIGVRGFRSNNRTPRHHMVGPSFPLNGGSLSYVDVVLGELMVEDSWNLHETGRTVKDGISLVMVGPEHSWSSIHPEY